MPVNIYLTQHDHIDTNCFISYKPIEILHEGSCCELEMAPCCEETYFVTIEMNISAES